MSKVRDLPETTSLDDQDLVYAVDASDGVNGGRKITKANLKTSVAPTDAETKTAYENNADTNAFTDAEKAKLAGIESGAAADQDADQVPFDNNNSTLDATNVEAAINELDAEKENAFVKNTAFNKDFGSAEDTIVEGNDKRLITPQRVTVKLDPGPGEFSSIKAAVDSILDASVSKPYQVNIGPGVYVEDTISVPPFVHVRGEREATVVRAADPDNDIFIVGSNCSIAQMRIEGATGTNSTAFRRTGGTTESEINLVEFGDNTNLLLMDSTAGAPTVIVNNCRVPSGTEFVRGFSISGTGDGVLVINGLTGVLTGTGNNSTDAFFGTGATNKMLILASNIRTEAPASLTNGVNLQDGIKCFISTLNLIGPDTGVCVGNVGVGPELAISGLTITSQVNFSVQIQNPGTTGFINGAWDFSTLDIDDTASENLSVSFNEVGSSSVGTVKYGDIIQGGDNTSLLNISKLNREEATLGVITGGQISNGVGLLELNVSAGNGFLTDSNGNAKEVTWEAINLFTPADTSRQVTVNENGVVQLEASLPADLSERVVLGRVISGDSSIVRIENSTLVSKHHGNLVERYLRNTFGALFASGSVVSENGSTDRALDVTSGEYYFGTKRYIPSGGNEISFSRIIRDGLGDFTNEALSQTIIPNNQYDNNSGSLVAIPSGHYAKGVLLLGGDGSFERYTYVFAQETFADLNDVVAADLPQLPAEVGEALTPIAAIIVQEGQVNFTQIDDIRPRPSFAASGAGSSSDHGGLTGLLDDDHPQYFLTNGNRTMTGNVDMGGNNINNVGTVGGVDISDHSTRHLPNGADALDTAAPLTNLSGNTLNSVGTANSFSRSDHTHQIENASGSVAGLMSSSDKNKIDGIESGATQDQNASEVPYNNAGSGLSATDVNDAIDEVQSNVDTVSSSLTNHLNGAAGKHDATEIDYERADGSKTDIAPGSDDVESAVSDLDDNKLSRSGSQAMTGDLPMGGNNITGAGTVNGVTVESHGSRHNPGGSDPVSTAAPSSNLTGNTTNQEGVATSLSRSDHSHNIDTGAPSSNLTGDTTNAEGSSPNMSRSDHSHAIDTGTPSGSLGGNSTNTEGSSSNLARADHTHDMATGAASTQTPAQANAEGSSNNLARADHTHNFPVGTPVNTGDANAEGAAASFSRSDHVHNMFPALEINQAEDATFRSTTGGLGTAGNGQRLTTASLPAGLYKIEWYYTWSYDDTTSDFLAEVELDSTDILVNHVQEPQDSGGAGNGGTNQRFPAAGHAYRNLAAGVHTIDINYGGGGATSSLHLSRISLMRVG